MSPTGGPAVSLADEQRDVARSRIIRAAVGVLAVQGLDATVDDVATAAGVGRRTVFRHYATRDALVAAALSEAVRIYGDSLPGAPAAGVGLDDWLLSTLVAVHRANAEAGRSLVVLAEIPADAPPDLRAVAVALRHLRRRWAAQFCEQAWSLAGGRREPPAWVADAVAVQLAASTTTLLTGDYGRDPVDAGAVAARTLWAVLAAALAEQPRF